MKNQVTPAVHQGQPLASSRLPERPPALQRAIVASAIATLTAIWFAWGFRRSGSVATDFDQLWFAAHQLTKGRDPYPLIGPGREFDQLWPLYYPLPGVFPAIAFSWLSKEAARTCYAFCIAWAFSFLIARDGWHRLTSVLSGAWLSAISLLQWAPIVACAILAPSVFGWVIPGKPPLGIAAMAAASDRRAFAWFATWAIALIALSFVVFPGWFNEWCVGIATATHIRPFAARTGGFLLLLALLRWRRPEARWLALLAIVPNTVAVADSLVLFAFPHSFRQGLSLALLTHAANFYLVFRPRLTDHAASIAQATGATLVFVLLPALAAVLTRPNELRATDADAKSRDNDRN